MFQIQVGFQASDNLSKRKLDIDRYFKNVEHALEMRYLKTVILLTRIGKNEERRDKRRFKIGGNHGGKK